MRLAALRKAEEEEKMSRTRRLEARLKKEEDEREKRDSAREKRRKDREEREERLRQRRKMERYGLSVLCPYVSYLRYGSSSVDSPIEVVGDGTPRKAVGGLKSMKSSTTTSGSRTPAEDWELDCEICHRKGANQVLFFLRAKLGCKVLPSIIGRRCSIAMLR